VRSLGQQKPRGDHQRTIRYQDRRYLPRRSYDPPILVRHSVAQIRHGIHANIMAEDPLVQTIIEAHERGEPR
jgi:hypothetical protein